MSARAAKKQKSIRGASTSRTKTRAGRGQGAPTSQPNPMEEEPYSRLFFTEEGDKRFKSWNPKNCVRERGICVSRRHYSEIPANIQQRQWHEFCKSPNSIGSPSLTKEFLANLPDRQGDKVFVRGTWVSFSALEINKALQLPTIAQVDDQFRSFELADKDYDAILSTLSMPGARWRISQSGGRELQTRTTQFIPRAWFYFLLARLIPSEHHSKITQDRALLLYAILEGMTIDVGRVIRSGLIHLGDQATTSNPAHPVLITLLCHRANIFPDPGESLVPVQAPISDSTIAGYKPPALARRAESQQEEPPAAAPAPPPVADSQATEWVQYVAAQNSHMMNYHIQHARYEAEQHTAWTDLFARMNIHANFPAPPPFPEFHMNPPNFTAGGTSGVRIEVVEVDTDEEV